MLVAFAGIQGRMGGVPAFEFANLTSDLPAHRVFLRDPGRLYFQRGVPGAGGSALEVADFLRAHRDRLGVRRVVTLGNSVGGYAAVLFGALLDADEAHAIATKTSIRGADDFHDVRIFERLRDEGRVPAEFADLREVLLSRPTRRLQVHLHYPGGHALDTRQAWRLDRVPGVHLHRYPWPDHRLVRVLRDRGFLARFVRDALTGRSSRHAWTVRWAALRLRLVPRRAAAAED
jgi:pimeloyl-ACP methyl ester carboxylesterase